MLYTVHGLGTHVSTLESPCTFGPSTLPRRLLPPRNFGPSSLLGGQAVFVRLSLVCFDIYQIAVQSSHPMS